MRGESRPGVWGSDRTNATTALACNLGANAPVSGPVHLFDLRDLRGETATTARGGHGVYVDTCRVSGGAVGASLLLANTRGRVGVDSHSTAVAHESNGWSEQGSRRVFLRRASAHSWRSSSGSGRRDNCLLGGVVVANGLRQAHRAHGPLGHVGVLRVPRR
jgi:hypothetical protein